MDAAVESGAESSPTTTMIAMVQRRYGGPETLELARIPRPSPADDEVLVSVHSAGVDRGVWHLMRGLPYLVRLGFGLRRPRQPVIGLDLSGTVVAVGAAVTRFAAGDQVMGIGRGSFAEYAVAQERKLATKPPGLGFEEASVVSISGITALQAVADVGALEPGQRVLVIGASGGVGSFAVQIARALGGRVSGVCGAGATDFVAGLGVEQVFDYRADDYLGNRPGYDLIIDCGGRNPLRRLRSALHPRGTLVIVGGEGGSRLTGGVERQLAAMLGSRFVGQRLATFIADEGHQLIERVCRLIRDGQVRPRIGGRYALAQAPEALADLERGGIHGKLTIEVRRSA